MNTHFNPWTRITHWVAFGFGAGCLPKAPGTWGSAAALLFFPLFLWLPSWGYAAVWVLLFFIGCWVCDVTGRDARVPDHPGIVFDEMVGMWLVLWGCPLEAGWLLTALVLFRLFDITKPYPIRAVERAYPNGFGVMADDVLAAIYAGLVLHGLMMLLRL